jgi:hypothetical protein
MLRSFGGGNACRRKVESQPAHDAVLAASAAIAAFVVVVMLLGLPVLGAALEVTLG